MNCRDSPVSSLAITSNICFSILYFYHRGYIPRPCGQVQISAPLQLHGTFSSQRVTGSTLSQSTGRAAEPSGCRMICYLQDHIRSAPFVLWRGQQQCEPPEESRPRGWGTSGVGWPTDSYTHCSSNNKNRATQERKSRGANKYNTHKTAETDI